MMKRIERTVVSVAILAAGCALADVTMPGIFGDHMVLQRDARIPVWGWADPGEEVAVTLGDTRARTQAGAGGTWRVDLEKTGARSEPQTLTVQGRNTLTFKDVLVGDVWLCSGQSNMEYGYQNVPATGQVVDVQIRTFCVLKSAALTPLDNVYSVPEEIGLDTQMGHWQVEQPGGPWGGFSAVGYFFGKEIRRATGQPVGLIGSYWGGTPAQAWTSLAGLEQEPALSNYVNGVKNLSPAQKKGFPVKWVDYVVAMKKWDHESRAPFDQAMRTWEAEAKAAKAAGQPGPTKPQMAHPRPANPGCIGTSTTLFNGMIHPLIPYAIKGVIWYQGEANSYNGSEYGILFPNLIRDWRTQWGQGEFPFLFVQIAGYAVSTNDPTRGRWAWLREGQGKALALPNTGMATAIDLADAGNPGDIHPRNKLDVAKRLGLLARRLAYGDTTVVDAGPVFDSMIVEGDRIRVTFRNTGGGLIKAAPPVLPGQKPLPVPPALTGFQIAGEDRIWQPAQASIDGQSVVVSSGQVPKPVAVRYAWADYPPCSLYNLEGLPAFPFRTDDWK